MRLYCLLHDVISYNSGNSACEKGGQWQHALGLFVKMPHHNLLSNVFNYNSTISACEKGGQWQQAMRHNYLFPDVSTYSSAIIACEKLGKWKHAVGLLAKMRHNDALPNVISSGFCYLRLCEGWAMASRTRTVCRDATQLFVAERHQLQFG